MTTTGEDGPEDGVRTPTVFRSFLEAAGDRVTPSTLSKATLTDLSHTLEDLVLLDNVPGTVLTGFQESQHWHAEKQRYEALAGEGQPRSVGVFARGRMTPATAVRRFRLERSHPLAQEWFLFVLTDRFTAGLFGRELPDQAPAEEMDRQFASVWTFDAEVLGDLLGRLRDVAGSVSEQAEETVAGALRDYPPRPPDNNIQQRFTNAVFERLEAGRRRWRTSSLELLAAREQLQAQYRRLLELERLAATGTVAASIAHDLNNPLSTIAMAATTLPDIEAPDERTRLAGIVEREALRAGRITKDLLTFVSHRDPTRREVSLRTLLSDLVDGYGMADDRPVLEAAPDVTLRVDPDRIHQALANLVDNGLAAPGRRGPVRVSGSCHDRDVTLLVRDDGDGIDPSLTTRAFTPFVTTKPAGHGTGLGLAIARRHAEEHGGSVAIGETGPDGTVMILRLPGVILPDEAGETEDIDGSVEPDGSVAAPSSTADGSPSSGDEPPQRGRVLVVDDEPGMRGLLEALLRRDGWDVTAVEDHDAALDAAQHGPIEVAILDVGNDGRRLRELLETQQPDLETRTAFMTGSPPPGGQLDGRPVLGKPFSWQELAGLLAQLSEAAEPIAAPGDEDADATS